MPRFPLYAARVETEPEDLRDPNEHTVLEDAYAMITGATLLAIGLVLMKEAGIVTAGVAGIALLVSYKVHLGVGFLFFLINIPFFFLAWKTMGREFTVKTVIAGAMIFGLVSVAQGSMNLSKVHPAFAALAGGTCAGMGVLALLRHHTGIGGVNIVAVWLQKTRGWNAGRLHLMLDGLILLVALTAIPPSSFGWSALSVLAINGVLIAYHKPGRYLGH